MTMPRFPSGDCEELERDSALDEFRRDLRDGLRRTPRAIPSKYFYDARGSELFERICTCPEYYLTRSETAILETHALEIAALAGIGCTLVELGSGSSRKTRLVLDRLRRPAAYVPVDISSAALASAVHPLRSRYQALPILPVHADYTHVNWRLPERAVAAARRLFFFPGSTLGNFHPDDAERFLRHLRHKGSPGDGLLVGVDLVKDPAIITLAYNDRAGVTAEFNRNVLRRANRQLGTDFGVDTFAHEARFDPMAACIEMRLISRVVQNVRLDDTTFPFETGDAIITEYSYKYSLDGFTALAGRAGFTSCAVWTDPEGLFSVHFLIA